MLTALSLFPADRLAVLVQDDYGKSYLGTLDFLLPGLPLSAVVVTLVGLWMFQVAPAISF